MFKGILSAAALAVASTGALAQATLPISATYGTDIGCADYLGRDMAGDVEAILYVTPTEISGFEYGCEPVETMEFADGVFGAVVACLNSGDEVPSEHIIAIKEDAVAGTLAYSMVEGEPKLLRRCDDVIHASNPPEEPAK